MKIFMRNFLLALLVLMSAAALAASQAYRLHVDGLACPFCAYGIEKKLGAVKGVEKVETDIKSGTVIVIMKEGAVLEEKSAAKAVKDAGFTLRGFERAGEKAQ